MTVIRSQFQRLYAAGFVLLALLWPFWPFHDPWILGAGLAANAFVFAVVVHYVGSQALGFWQGLCALAVSYESGCANLTFLYIFFVLGFYYLAMIRMTWIGIRQGKAVSQGWWVRTVRARFATEQEFEMRKKPPTWFS